jgi:hypothetical protein
MKRIALVLVLAASALTVAGTAAADHGGGTRVQGDAGLVAHNVFGLQTLELKQFEFSARVVGPGDAARGKFVYREVDDGAPTDANGPIWCVTVIGNGAWIGGTIERSSDPTLVGLGGWWHVVDNGDQGEGGPPDITTFMGVGSIAATQAFCDTHPPFRHPFAIQRGDIQVGEGSTRS